MSGLIKHKYFAFALTVMIVTLPLLLVIVQQKQEIRGSAQASTTLYFSPISSSTLPITKKVGESINLDLMLNPGVNLVSLVKLEIIYDSTKLTPSANPVSINETIFPTILEGPIYFPGKIQMIVSVGPDLSKAINQTNRVATINFDTIASSGQTLVSLSANTSVSSVAQNDSISENVLSSASPAYINITKAKGIGSGGGGKGKPSR